jgi:hypothetical protein
MSLCIMKKMAFLEVAEITKRMNFFITYVKRQ